MKRRDFAALGALLAVSPLNAASCKDAPQAQRHVLAMMLLLMNRDFRKAFVNCNGTKPTAPPDAKKAFENVCDDVFNKFWNMYYLEYVQRKEEAAFEGIFAN